MEHITLVQLLRDCKEMPSVDTDMNIDELTKMAEIIKKNEEILLSLGTPEHHIYQEQNPKVSKDEVVISDEKEKEPKDIKVPKLGGIKKMTD